MTNKVDNTENEAIRGQTPLQGWKEIASYLERDARTARRWEQQAGLPVRRHGGDRGSVYAYRSELDAWRVAHKPKAEEEPERPYWHRLIPALAGGVALLAAVSIVQWGPIMNPPDPLAEAANSGGGVRLRQVWAGTEVDVMGSVSREGRYLSFVNWATGDLGFRDLVAGESRLLTNKGGWEGSEEFAESSVISPDARQVVYAWFNEDLFYDLRLIGLKGIAGGEQPRILYSNRELNYIAPTAWFPDGRRILALFQRKDRTVQIVIFDIEDQSLKVLKTVDWRWPGKTALSPDGRYILYDFPAGEGDAPRDIFVLAADGSSEVPLVTHPSHDEVLGWTPDGSSVLFASDRGGRRGAWLLPVADGKPQGPPSIVKAELDVLMAIGFSSDGALFYGNGTGMQDVYTVALDLEAGKLLRKPDKVTQRFVGSNRAPAWSPDGKYLAYISRRRLAAGRSRTIVVRSMETGDERDLRLNLGYFGQLRWAADGRSLSLAARDDRSRSTIFRLDAETGELTKVVAPEPDIYYSSAQPSPDGKSLLYTATNLRTKHAAIRTRSLAGGEDKEVYRTKALWLRFDLSPAGGRLAMIEADRETRSAALKVLPAGGGSPQELVRFSSPEAMGRHPAWTRDGKRILFWKRQDIRSDSLKAELWSVPIDGGPPRSTGLSGEHTSLLPISVHPEGRQIAFTAGKNRTEIWVMENFLPELKAAK